MVLQSPENAKNKRSMIETVDIVRAKQKMPEQVKKTYQTLSKKHVCAKRQVLIGVRKHCNQIYLLPFAPKLISTSPRAVKLMLRTGRAILVQKVHIMLHRSDWAGFSDMTLQLRVWLTHTQVLQRHSMLPVVPNIHQRAQPKKSKFLECHGLKKVR